LLLALALPLAAGCIPYSTGTTAVPTAPGTVQPNLSAYFIPGGLDYAEGDSTAASLVGADMVMRVGLDNRSDLGIRVPGFVGILVDYKRRLDAGTHEDPALAAMFGGGVVNLGDHALVEAALLASGRQSAQATPYGGIKAMQVFPLHREAVTDQPTVGIFGGLRLGTERLGISPEVGIFYDPSALGLRESNWIVVPSFTLHGRELIDLVLGGGSGTRPPPSYPRPRPPGGRWP
jgi:hypothetical protein